MLYMFTYSTQLDIINLLDGECQKAYEFELTYSVVPGFHYLHDSEK